MCRVPQTDENSRCRVRRWVVHHTRDARLYSPPVFHVSHPLTNTVLLTYLTVVWTEAASQTSTVCFWEAVNWQAGLRSTGQSPVCPRSFSRYLEQQPSDCSSNISANDNLLRTFICQEKHAVHFQYICSCFQL